MAPPGNVLRPAKEIIELEGSETPEGGPDLVCGWLTTLMALLGLEVALLEIEELKRIGDAAELEKVSHPLACATLQATVSKPRPDDVQEKQFDGQQQSGTRELRVPAAHNSLLKPAPVHAPELP
jgi:hypothetical protein